MRIGRLVGFILLGALPALAWGPAASSPQLQRTAPLTMDERVTAQRAIEQVYWNHRIWPKENPTPKPPLSSVMSDDAIRAKVEDYLKKSNALQTWWSRPITGEQLQAELDRMAKGTHDPKVLQELFSALGNDPYVIAETLGRQTLSDRLIRNWYANDTRFHADVRAKAEAALKSCSSIGCLKAIGGEYRETTIKLEIGSSNHDAMREPGNELALDAEQWGFALGRLSRTFGTDDASIPVGSLSQLAETSDSFSVNAVLSRTPNHVKTATVAWLKLSFDSWWTQRSSLQSARVSDTVARMVVPTVQDTPCADDTWSPTSQEFPDPRYHHTAVWTGTEMIVWGGYNFAELNTGGRYNPATDTWRATTIDNAPTARQTHTTIWTGTEMIVWGGSSASGRLAAGGRYDPETDQWRPLSTLNEPSPRNAHSVVWTGSEMIVWGGFNGTSFLNSGGRYNPATDTWTPTDVSGSGLNPRSGHSAVWTGDQMIVWGGTGIAGGRQAYFTDGARYSPSTDSWTSMAIDSVDGIGRSAHSAIWTGTLMIVWGGQYADPGQPIGYLNSGPIYDPSTDTWRRAALFGQQPSGRISHVAVWTGTDMVIWGGFNGSNAGLNTGGRYDPTTDTWAATSVGANVPGPRTGATGVWTGHELLVWGGQTRLTLTSTRQLFTGGRYDPTTDTWVPTANGAPDPEPRLSNSAVWTGSELIVWGGEALETTYTMLNSGGRYDPATNAWKSTALDASTPSPRSGHAAAWTGSEMLIWGGGDLGTPLNTGGRYNPSADGWTTMTTVAAPAAGGPSAVWTGDEMIVWGGSPTSSGGRYAPSSDSWRPTAITPQTPTARYGHAAVWTGNEMIVWGGTAQNSYGTHFNTGGRYSPSTDTWLETSTGPNVPTARSKFGSAWTGSEMIVWAGEVDSGGSTNTGGRYDPSTDSWLPTTTVGAPPATDYPATVWTGQEMVAWGSGNAGGRYSPGADQWQPTTAIGAPSSRLSPTAVWTKTHMIVWGGTWYTSSGGLYCVCPSSHTVYLDADGDGFGDAAMSRSSACDGSISAGYVDNNLDCDDTNPAIYPNAPEVNDGLDNECPGDPGYGVIDELSSVMGFFDAADKTRLSWDSQAGATTYNVLRSATPDSSSGCALFTASSTAFVDSRLPSAGSAFFYLVRPATPHTGSWGQRTDGTPRSVACAP